MKKLLIATTNLGKLVELSSFLSDLQLKLVSLKEVGIVEDIEETGKTYKENSKKKAMFYAKKSGLAAIADDGGIEIDALDGAPGVYSRRYFGENGKEASDEEIIKKMIDLIKTLPKEKLGARFKTVVTFALPSGETYSSMGVVRGLLQKPKLKLLKGYPYRSFFFLPKLNRYYIESELTIEEMREYNHRYKAVKKLKSIIKNVILSEAKESHGIATSPSAPRNDNDKVC